jgi:hypothetical protein
VSPTPTAQTTQITVERLRHDAVPGRYFGAGGGRLVGWKWTYEAHGPDGTKFTNDSIVTLRSVLRRRYPGVTIVEPWKAKR